MDLTVICYLIMQSLLCSDGVLNAAYEGGSIESYKLYNMLSSLTYVVIALIDVGYISGKDTIP